MLGFHKKAGSLNLWRDFEMHRSFKKSGAVLMAAAMLVNGTAVSGSAVAADGPQRYEFEDGVFTGTGEVKTDSTASGGKYFFLEGNSDTVTLTVNAPSTGMYNIKIGYNAAYGNKIQNLYINGVDQGQISFTSKTWAEVDCGAVKLQEGDNEVMIKSSWGWTNFDYLTVEEATLSEIKATQTDCCDIKATAETRSLMAYLASVYGNGIISGQQEIYSGGPHGLEYEFEYLEELTGHKPAIRGFDYGNFCCPCYGSDDGSTDRVIDWVKNNNGIATASFHLNVPTDFESYTIGSRIDWAQTTYTQNCDFSPSKAATEGTKENEYYMQSLDILAKEFLKLQDEGIPVIWRPLHEAEGSGGETGSWFWWGREGSESYKKLWIYTYDVLVNQYGCHNLIWEWNSYNYETSPSWYPGDEYVDIIGYDKYSCTDWSTGSAVLNHNDSPVSSTFYGIMEKYDSAKMISMAENDCFSTVENLNAEKAGWLYFCTWYDGGSDDTNFLTNPVFNTEEDTIAMYQSDYCITLDELPADLYKKDIPPVDPALTTTKVTTTKDPTHTTTTPADFTFEVKSYKLDIPYNRDMLDKLIANIKGAPKASIGGALGYGTSADDWTNLEWKGNADAKGDLKVEIDVSEIPDSIKTVEFQIWWSNVWDSATETATDKDCDLDDYMFTSLSSILKPIPGDANEDGEVTVADAAAILQYLGNSEENKLSEQGLANADVDGVAGITPADAVTIQKFKAKLIDKFPVEK